MYSNRVNVVFLFFAFLLACLFCSSDDTSGAGPALLILSIAAASQIFLTSKEILNASLEIFVIIACGVLLAVKVFYSPVEEYGLADLALLLAGVLSLFMGSQLVSEKAFYRNLVVILLALTLLHVGTVFYQNYHDEYWLPFYKEKVDTSHVAGLYVHRNYLGNFIAAITCIVFAGSFFLERKSARIGTAFLSCLLFGLSVYTGSRGALLALSFGALSVLLLFIYWKWLDKKLSVKAMAYIGVSIVLLVCASFFGFKSILSSRGLDLIATNLHGREHILKIAIELILDKPLSGSGARAFHWRSVEFWPKDFWVGAKDLNYAHNEYLQLFVDYGLVAGGLSLLVIFGFLSLSLWLSKELLAKHRLLYAGAFGCIVVFLVQSMVSFPLHMLPNVMLFAFCLGVVFGVTGIRRSRLEKVVYPFIALVVVFCFGVGVKYSKSHAILMKRDKNKSRAINYMSEQKAFAESSNDFSEYRSLGDLYFTKAFGESDAFIEWMTKAKNAYLKAQDLHPYDLKTEVALGVCYDYLSEFGKADLELRRAEKRGAVREVFLDTNRRLVKHYIAWGTNLYSKRMPEEALFCFHEALYFNNKKNQRDPEIREDKRLIDSYIKFLQRAEIKPKAPVDYGGYQRLIY